MKTERVIDPQAVEASEYARKNGKVVIAAELAAIGLGLTNTPLMQEEVAAIATAPEQRAILSCLARIHVDSLKSIANQTNLPHKAIPVLERATTTLQVVHRNISLKEALREVVKDHRDREHHFLPEMVRDEAKTLAAASKLYDTPKANDLNHLGEYLLFETYCALPDNHPTKPLISVELELSRAARGLNPNFERLREDFETLRVSDEEKNPHRVATVASWLVVWGEKLGDETIERVGRSIFDRLILRNPEWNSMISTEQQKLALQQSRDRLFRQIAPVTITPSRRKSLHKKLMER